MTIYNITGWGKGKTTSAIGIAARALGNEERVLFCQFLKSGWDKGITVLEEYADEYLCCDSFLHLYQGTEGFKKEDCTALWYECIQAIAQHKPDLVILDELNVALDNNLISIPNEEIIDYLKLMSKFTDIYITGRINNHKLRHQMFEISDIATNCFCEAHNYNTQCKDCGMEFSKDYKYCPICGKELTHSQKARVGREC